MASLIASLSQWFLKATSSVGWYLVLALFPAMASATETAGDNTKTIAGDVNLAVASNFAQTAKELATSFTAETGHKVRLSFGSSGKLYAQIVNGAPFDVFLSADLQKPRALISAGLAAASRTYATGKLILWMPDTQRNVDSWEEFVQLLRGTTSGKIAFANPRVAPYGAAALQVIEALGLAEETHSRWVMGENIAQTYQFASTGNAAIGFVAASQLHSLNADNHHPKDPVDWVIVPQELHDPIEQGVVLLKRSADNQAAQEFYAYLVSPRARAIILQAGYVIE